MTWEIHRDVWKLKAPFTTARHYFEEITTLTVVLQSDHVQGRGEAVGVDNLGENIDSLERQLRQYLSAHAVIDRRQLQSDLPPGGARNALDCALWDLECKRAGKRIWDLLDLSPQPVHTVYTLPVQGVAEMAANAKSAQAYPILKVKLDADQPIQKMEGIRAARPDAKLIVDCNQGWTMEILKEAAPAFDRLGVEMIEQPLKVGEDQDLMAYSSPLPLCADESCNVSEDLAVLSQKYQMVNIKLDKTGGLTEALALAVEAQKLGLGLMVGNMLGSSLGMAPAFVIAQSCSYVDLDGPLLQQSDRPHSLRYNRSLIDPPETALWG